MDCEISETLEPSQMTQTPVMEESSKRKNQRQQYSVLIKLSLTQYYVSYFSYAPSTLAGKTPEVSLSFEQNYTIVLSAETEPEEPGIRDLPGNSFSSPGRISSKGQWDILLSLWITFPYSSQDCCSFKKLKAIALFRCCFSVTMSQLSAVSQAEARTTLDIPFRIPLIK